MAIIRISCGPEYLWRIGDRCRIGRAARAAGGRAGTKIRAVCKTNNDKDVALAVQQPEAPGTGLAVGPDDRGRRLLAA
jgi:hypothetical protein